MCKVPSLYYKTRYNPFTVPNQSASFTIKMEGELIFALANIIIICDPLYQHWTCDTISNFEKRAKINFVSNMAS